MVVALPFNASLTSLHLLTLLHFCTSFAVAGYRSPRPSRTTTFARLTSSLTMSSRRSARLSARAQAEPAGQDTPSTPMLASSSTPATKSRKRKVPPAEDDVPAKAPATPKRGPPKKTAVHSPAAAPTATPSAVRLIAEPAAAAVSTPKPRAVERLADPNLTNAPLLSPETSRVISYNPTTTANILEEACAHLIKGKVFHRTKACHCRCRCLCVARASSGGWCLLYMFHAPSQRLLSREKTSTSTTDRSRCRSRQ
jgi:hypothetical protein